MGNVKVFFFLFAFFTGSLVGNQLNGYEVLLTVDGILDALYLIQKYTKEELPLAFSSAMAVYAFFMAIISYIANKQENTNTNTKSEDKNIPDWFVQVIDIEN